MTDVAARPAAAPPPDAAEWRSLLAGALRGEGVSSVFQPIVDLQRLAVVGYEALARFVGPPELTPDRWFAAAAAGGVLPSLEAASLRSALARRPHLPPNCFLSVNVEPESLGSPEVMRAFADAGNLRGLVVEITEHRPMLANAGAGRALAALREAGALVAVDDAGAGHSGLQQILELRPSILKLDRVLVAGVDVDEAKAALVEMLGVFANKIDAWLLAEGVETQAEARRLIDLGVPLAQGYFFGRPANAWASPDASPGGALEPRGAEAKAGTLGPLVETVGWVASDQVAQATQRLRAGAAAMFVVLDADRRPVGVLTREAVRRGEASTPLFANVNSSAREIAQRLATRRPTDTASPVVVSDNAGRYLGVVTIPRLLAALADL